LDEVQMVHYDSNTMKTEPKQDWMEKNTDQQYWESQTQIGQGNQQVFKADFEELKQRFNQTGGLFILLIGLVFIDVFVYTLIKLLLTLLLFQFCLNMIFPPDVIVH
uniref:MHC class I-like antigen recognition-like domain-containing protein n=1 Tax=Kryptolebias marmoratus TaxID=37003 RepID=A0A3Q3BG35_KRYMA